MDYYGECEHLYLSGKPFAGTPFQNCKLTEYRRASKKNYTPVNYLRKFQRHPNMEAFLSPGFETFAMYLALSPKHSSYGQVRSEMINWKEKTPYRMLGVSKPDMKWLKGRKFDARDILRFGSVRKWGPDKTPEEIGVFMKDYEYDLKEILHYGREIWKIDRYLRKQKKKTQCLSNVLRTWMDYLRMAGVLENDVNLPEIRYPKNLEQAHDRAAAAIKYKIN